MTHVIDTRYSSVFSKVELAIRVHDEQCDGVVETRMFFNEKELREVIEELSTLLSHFEPVRSSVEEECLVEIERASERCSWK